MVLEFIKDNLNGDSWELWCDDCYRDRYQSNNYVKIPANYKGDAGIEGFTQSGIAYQSYCPEKEYSDNELYDHLRDKLTTDINKLISKDNAKRLFNLGVHNIKEWHFVIPEYRDKRILEHIETKTQEVLKVCKDKPSEYKYIDSNFKIIIKIAEDFKVEFARLIRNPLVDLKLNAAVKSVKDVDWTKCEAQKIENIKRKIKAIMNVDNDNEDFKVMIKFWAESYLKGIEIMSGLQMVFGEIYEELFDLEQQYKLDVSAKAMMNTDRSLNNKIFSDILDEFGGAIEKQFSCFSQPTIMELKRDLVSGWLADCSLQFRVR